MILLPAEADVLPFLTRCLLNGDVRDVRKMNAAVDDDDLADDRREYLRDAKQRSRAKAKR